MIRYEYAVAVKNRFEELNNDTASNWDAFKMSLVESVKEILPKKEKKKKSKWISDEILQLMEHRQQITDRNSKEYKDADKNIKNQCRIAKEIWLNDKCKEIEQERNSASMHKKIKELTRRGACTSAGCIKSNEGEILMDKEEVLERWTEYIGELFNDERIEKPSIRKNVDGPKILKSEVKSAISRMKNNKAAGPD